MTNDLQEWLEAVKDVKPIKKKKTIRPQTGRKEIFISHVNFREPEINVNFSSLPYLTHGSTESSDGITAKKLQSGHHTIDGKIDLHGHIVDDAFGRLQDFIRYSYSTGKRCVLVITGKGSGMGVLKEEVPKWLNAPGIREYINMFSYAARNHGGDGALYVILKKNGAAEKN